MALREVEQLVWIYQLYQYGQTDSQITRIDQVFELILQHIVEGFSADRGSLFLYKTDDAKDLSIVANIGLSAESMGCDAVKGNCVIKWVLQHKQARLFNSMLEDEHFPQKCKSQIPVSVLSWPLILDNKLIGILCVNRVNVLKAYTDADLTKGKILANLVALVLENIKLHADQNCRIQQLAETKERLIESETRMFSILDSLDCVVWSMDPTNLKLTYLNQAVYDISGRTVNDFLANPDLWLNIIVIDDKPSVEYCFNTLLDKGIQKVRYRILRPDNEIRWIFMHMRLVTGRDGKALRIDGVAVDITKHKIDEDLLKQKNSELQTALDTVQEMQRQLVQSEKLSSIGQLAAGVAHEINNPIGYVNSNLTSLKNYLIELLTLINQYQQIEACCTDSQKIKNIQAYKDEIDLEFTKNDVMDLLKESQEGASRVMKIVQDLKDFSYIGADDDWQWANLHHCLESTLNIIHNEIKYKAKVIKKFGEIPDVWCLQHQLNQVIMNLLVNAAHAIDKNGVITIRTGVDENAIWLEVSDNGKGILPEHIDKIFDPFFTTKPVGQGTGLGLSVSYNIIKKHKGEILIDSQVGQGSTFRIILPRNSHK